MQYAVNWRWQAARGPDAIEALASEWDDLIGALGLLSWGADFAATLMGAKRVLDVDRATRSGDWGPGRARGITELGGRPSGVRERVEKLTVEVTAKTEQRDHAIQHRDAGVDLVIAQGTEGGGHTGEIGTMVLVPQVVDAVAPIPVLAAGGIATGRQVAAALALGAEGVWCGSVWLTTHEAETTPVIKEKFLAATSADTRRSRSLTGKPARMLRSAWTEEWENPENPDPLPLPLQSALIAEARTRIARSSHEKGSGAEQLDNYFVGQVVGQLDRVKTCRQVIEEMVSEYVDVMNRFAEQVG